MNEREKFEAWLYVQRNERWSTAVLAFEAFKAGAALSAPPAGYVLPQGERMLLMRWKGSGDRWEESRDDYRLAVCEYRYATLDSEEA